MTDRFYVTDQGLIREVTRSSTGSTYSQRCTLENFKRVAWLIDQAARPITTADLWEMPDVPCTQASVALAFLKERGCVVTYPGRRSAAASDALYEDALTEYFALAEGSPGA